MKYPAYQINIPAVVRFDKNLLPNAKLLYGEITALCDQQGYCWAGNNHLANLYGVQAKVVSRWISQLCKHGYLHVEICRGNQRKIYINTEPPKKDTLPPSSVEGCYPNVEGGLPKDRGKEGLHLINNFIDYNDRINNVPVSDLSTKKWREQKEKKADRNSLTSGELKIQASPSPPVAPSPPPQRIKAVQKFVKPSVKEVETYMVQSDHCQDSLTARGQALRFVNYYEANGWKVGRNNMQDWKAAARNWLLNSKDFQNLKSNINEPIQYSSENTGNQPKDYSIPL